jgi:hypothetical protein
VIKNLHQTQNVKYRKLLQEVGKAWVIEKNTAAESISGSTQPSVKEPMHDV